MTETPSRSPAAGAIALALGLVAFGLYVLVGTAAEGEGDVPASRFILAALLVVTGVALRAPGAPRWIVFVAAALAGLIAIDLVLLLVGTS